MADRDVSIDILAHDKTDRATKSAIRNFDDLKKKVSKATDSVSDSLGKDLLKKMKPIGALMIKPLVAGLALGAPAIAAAITSAAALGVGAAFLVVAAIALKENKKLQKQFEKTSSTIKNTLAKAAQPLVGPFTKALKSVSALVKGLAPDFKSIFKSLAPVVPLMMSAFGGVVKEVVGALKDSMPGVTAAFKGLAGALPTVGKWIGEFIRTLLGNPAVIENTTKALTLMAAGPLKLLGPLLSGLTVIFGAQVNVMRLYQIAGGQLWPKLVKWFDDGSGAVGRLKAAWGPLWDAIQNVWNKLKEFAAAKTDKDIIAKFGALIKAIKDTWGPLKTFIGTVWAEAWAFVKRKWDEVVVPWWNNTAKPWLQKNLAGAMDEIFKMAVDKAVRWLKSLPGKAWEAIKGVPGRILSLVGSMGAAGKGIGNAFVNAAVNAISNAAGRIAQAIRNAISQAKNSLPGALQAAASALGFGGTDSWRAAQVMGQFAGGQGFAFAGGGHTRAGGPVQVNQTLSVSLDGQPFYSYTDQKIAAAERRQEWRQKVGRR